MAAEQKLQIVEDLKPATVIVVLFVGVFFFAYFMVVAWESS